MVRLGQAAGRDGESGEVPRLLPCPPSLRPFAHALPFPFTLLPPALPSGLSSIVTSFGKPSLIALSQGVKV